MKNKMGLVRKGMELLILGAAAGILIAGCGGGGGGGGGTNSANGSRTPVASYIADGQGTSFIGTWFNFNGLLGTSAVATTYTLNTNPTTGTYALISTSRIARAASGVWANSVAGVLTGFDLAPAGWIAKTGTFSFVDGMDGIHATQYDANGSATPFSVSQTNLAGTAITCTNGSASAVVCAAPGNYPAGSSQYVLTQTGDTYTLPNPATAAYQLTDATGTALASLPTVGSGTFCEPSPGLSNVYQPASAVGTYNVYNSFAGCTSLAIASAVAAASSGTVQLASKQTGNSNVPTVLVYSSWTGVSLTGKNFPNSNFMISPMAGKVYSGAVIHAGLQQTEKNKIAINAELVAAGIPAIP